MGWLSKIERLLLVLGLLLLGIYVGARLHKALLSRLEVQRFKARLTDTEHGFWKDAQSRKVPDFALWSQKRIADYQESLAAHLSPTIALLRIPKINLEAPVLEGTSDLNLNRGVGLIEGTARPGPSGNIGIAGHRDGFFRGLKDVRLGDLIEIDEQDAIRRYVIDRIIIVAPDDVSVLASRERASVTLVTCYPFYFVGSAPWRYIVQASLLTSDPRSLRAQSVAKSAVRRVDQ